VPFTLTLFRSHWLRYSELNPDRHLPNECYSVAAPDSRSEWSAAAKQSRSADSQVSDTERMKSKSHVMMKWKRKLSVCQSLMCGGTATQLLSARDVGLCVSVWHFVPCVIAGYRRGENESIAFLGWSAAWIGTYGRFGTTYRIHLRGSSPPRISGLLYPCIWDRYGILNRQ